MDLCSLTAADLRSLLDSRKVSAKELVSAHLTRIAERNDELNAFLTVSEERALADADRAQGMIDADTAKPLTGIPYALKDNIVTSGIRTTCSSRILENYIPPYDSTLVTRANEQGMCLLGKTNLDEFAMGSSTEHSAFGPTRNPCDLSRVPGGSSGGSAAAAAARLAVITFGSDTGGSVRQPASLCGIVGFKPTYGRVSRFGLVAFCSSLDQIGPFGRSVADVTNAFEFSMGADGKDSTVSDQPYSSETARSFELKGARIGVAKELIGALTEPGVMGAFTSGLDKLSDAGAAVEEFSVPIVEHGVSTYYIIAPAEASSNLARFDGVRYGLRVEGDSHIDMMKATRAAGFGNEVKERIMIGTYVLSSGYYDAFYAKAQKARAVMKLEFQKAFEKYDFIVSPTSPTVAFKIGDKTGDPLALKLADYCTIPANMGGFPAISINCGFVEGLPVGFQIIGNSFEDDRVLGAARSIEALLA
ncbi:MAG: Asp-tRNA(Asn)/Glu-tRNA(Gln) amidotransferase subunit GatA [Armatimonadota bacterium]|nr:Asp-tRNA(Asn)/Glu-tRNA(Gln) amidotransferase subunit GatA [Armatimonadota bacterium]